MLNFEILDKGKFLSLDELNLINNISKIFNDLLDENLNYKVNVNIIDNKEIQILNKNYRNIDKATDVLSFADLEVAREFPQIDNNVFLGDIFISYPKIEEQAKEYNVSLNHELALMLIHGILHLLSFDHIEEEEAREMEYMEDQLLRKLFNN